MDHSGTMAEEQSANLTAGPGPRERTVRTPDGRVLSVPEEWILVPPGDAALTRRLKAAGPTWAVQEKKGRKIFSRGLWTSAATVEAIRRALEQERSTESYARKRAADLSRRNRQQEAYVGDFESAVLNFLDFLPVHRELAERLARAVTAHATPVGSGTVARTKRIPIERRAESAVIAWLRHQTTAYDSLRIARVRGERRKVRTQLANESRRLLNQYRREHSLPADCPIARALQESSKSAAPSA